MVDDVGLWVRYERRIDTSCVEIVEGILASQIGTISGGTFEAVHSLGAYFGNGRCGCGRSVSGGCSSRSSIINDQFAIDKSDNLQIKN